LGTINVDKELQETRARIEIEQIEKIMELAFILVTNSRITDREYDTLTSYPFSKRNKLQNELKQLKGN